MAEGKESNKKRRRESVGSRSVKGKPREDEFDEDLPSDMKGILSALKHIREKAQKDGQMKMEEVIGSLTSELKSRIDETRGKIEKERQNFVRSLSKSSKECENSLKNEAAKLQGAYEKFCTEKAAHLTAFSDLFSNFEDETEKLFARYEQQRKKDKTLLSDLEKACAGKISAAEDSLRRKKQDDKSFNLLRKSLGSLMDSASDEDFAPED